MSRRIFHHMVRAGFFVALKMSFILIWKQRICKWSVKQMDIYVFALKVRSVILLLGHSLFSHLYIVISNCPTLLKQSPLTVRIIQQSMFLFILCCGWMHGDEQELGLLHFGWVLSSIWQTIFSILRNF